MYTTDQTGFEEGLKAITASLEKGSPVIIDMLVPPDGHTVVVNGYDPNRKLISIVDPFIAAPGLRRVGYDEFEKTWRSVVSDVRGAIYTSAPSKL
ncbi:MAG: hypothetical protein Aurels2KO_32410 [Aureliella sp.]